MASWLALAVCVATAEVPVVSPPVLERPIVVDGDVSDSLGQGQQLAAFAVVGEGGAAPQQPTVAVMRDGKWLYVAARLPKPKGRLPKATVSQRDGQVWTDDALEIFVAPRGRREPYYQFIVNARGVQWDSLGKDPSWNANWKAAARARAEDGYWSVEVAIPLGPMWAAAGDNRQWGFNVGWDCRSPVPMVATWAPVERSFHEPERFGVMKMVAGAPRVTVAKVEVAPEGGQVEFVASVQADRPLQAEWAFGRPGALKTVDKKQVRSGRVAWKAAVPRGPLGLPREGGDYVAVASLSRSGEVLYRAVVALRAASPVEVVARKYVLRTRRVDVEVNAVALAMRRKVAAAEVSLRDAAGKAVVRERVALEGGRGRCSLDVKAAPPGRYRLHVAVAGPDGKAVYEGGFDEVIMPPRPQWLGNREGITDRVLPPWTPLRVSGRSVRPWGRVYRFGALPFPEQVETRGVEVLAGPMRLIATVNGRQQVWMGEGPVFGRRSGARVEFTTRAEGQDASVRGRLWCEYDGCIRSDWEIVGKRPDAVLERLVFEIPLRADYARLYYFYPGRWRSAFNAGAVPTEGMALGWKPYVWLGDEWRGLAWFCPSDEGYTPADRSRMVEVRREGDTVVLRVVLVEEPVSLRRPFSTTFGFEATPIRPNRKDVWDYRIIHTGNYGLEQRTWAPVGSIRWDTEGNISVAEGTLEAWVRPRFDPNVKVRPDDPSRGRYNRNFFVMKFGGYTVGFYWNIDDRGMRVYVQAPSGKYPVVFGARSNWKAGEWHHVALSWGRELRIYCDGALLAKRPWDKLWGTVPEDLRGGYFQIGGPNCEMDVDELCISDVQRPPRGHLGPLKPDEHTLILETFDALDSRPAGTVTVPAKAGGGPGRVDGPVRLVEGRFGKAASFWVPESQRVPVLKAYRDFGVRTICFHEHWSRIQNYFAPADPEGLRRLVEACHREGLRLVVYYGYELSNIAPEWECCRDEILIHPRGGGYHRKPEQRCYICCYKSAWQDYLAWAIARTMDEYDMDGVYLDGTANPFGCANVGHGCGYIGPDGKPRRTYPFFAVRRMMKRIYAIVKTRKPDGVVNVHQSTCMTIPSVGWATSYWDGEQFGSIPRTAETWPLDVLPLDAFRAEFMGHQWGVPAELLCYGRPYTFREALAIALVHDVLVRPRESQLELMSKIWKAAEAFGRHQARWLPYWENGEWVRVNDDHVKCSMYWREGKGVLVVVSNLGRQATEARVWLKWRRLGLPAQAEAYDVVSGMTQPCERGRLRFEMAPLEFRMIWVRAPGQ